MEDIANALITFAILAFVAFVIWSRTRIRFENRKLQLDAQARMLEKIGPGQALTDFLETDAGKRFFEDLSKQPPSPSRVLVLTTIGFVSLFAGIGLSVAAYVIAFDESQAIYVPAGFFVGVGIGALIAAWVTHRLTGGSSMLGITGTD